MERAELPFRQHGFQVITASTLFITTPEMSAWDFLPHAGALSASAKVFNEWLGTFWYRVVGPIEADDPIG